MQSMDYPKCDAGCGEDVEIRCDEAGYCGDCFATLASEALQELTGWKPCGHPIWPADRTRAPAIYMEPYGTEHSHADFLCDAEVARS